MDKVYLLHNSVAGLEAGKQDVVWPAGYYTAPLSREGHTSYTRDDRVAIHLRYAYLPIQITPLNRPDGRSGGGSGLS